MTGQNREQDVPMSVAIAGLVVIVGAWMYFQAPEQVSAALTELDRYGDANLFFLSVLLFATTINCVWVYSIFARTLGLNRQGRRLEILAKKNSKARAEKTGFPFVSLMIGALAFVPVFFYLRTESVGLPSFVPKQLVGSIWLVVSADVAFAIFVIFSVAERGGLFQKLKERGARLSEMPTPKNALVLGAIEETLLA